MQFVERKALSRAERKCRTGAPRAHEALRLRAHRLVARSTRASPVEAVAPTHSPGAQYA